MAFLLRTRALITGTLFDPVRSSLQSFTGESDAQGLLNGLGSHFASRRSLCSNDDKRELRVQRHRRHYGINERPDDGADRPDDIVYLDDAKPVVQAGAQRP